MPTVTVDAEALYTRVKGQVPSVGASFDLGRFVEVLKTLAFDYGLEYDGMATEAGDPQPKVKIDIPANRYDLLCLEGIAEAFCRFRAPAATPFARYKWTLAEPTATLTVKKSTFPLRPYCVAAIFRDVKFDAVSYASFIDLQDKLHQNLARRRTLVSMGSHNLDALKLPLTYACVPRKGGFKFAPLNHPEVEVDGEGMLELLASSYLKPYLPLVENEEYIPVVLDAEGHVGSVPPIINSELSKISVDTRNVLLEITATDHHKAEIVLDQIIAFMSDKLPEPFTVEPVKIVYEEGHPGMYDHRRGNEGYFREVITPRLNTNKFKVCLDYCRRLIGLKSLTMEQVFERLPMMGLQPYRDEQCSELEFMVECPITRRDILHPCDVVEDIAVAIGYNNIPYKAIPSVRFQSVQNLTDELRRAISNAGWRECLTFGLVSFTDCFTKLHRPADVMDAAGMYYSIKAKPIRVQEPKAREFEIVRTSLIPGLLNTLASNQAANLPIKLFEIGEVLSEGRIGDPLVNENGTIQKRHVAALIAESNRSALENIHGLLDYVLDTLGMNAVYSVNPSRKAHHTYRLEETAEDGAFLQKRCVKVMVKTEAGDFCIGTMGVVHPDTLAAFNIPFPCSLFEISLEPFLAWIHTIYAP